jgi:hypothetical protein
MRKHSTQISTIHRSRGCLTTKTIRKMTKQRRSQQTAQQNSGEDKYGSTPKDIRGLVTLSTNQ